jgi:transcriptional regulator with XRE-family HTH domain
VPEGHSPTVRRRELGALLRDLRLSKDLTVEQVAQHLLCSATKVSRMETGQRGATARDIRDLCDLYEITDPAERERLARLAVQSRQHGWWQDYDLSQFADYVGLEAAAASIRDFQSSLIPGLLQTPDYARAVNEVVVPVPDAETLDRQTEVRLKRQQRLTGHPPLRFHVVLGESALHRLVGGPAIMSAQLDRLAELSSLPNVTLQIIPFSAGAHPAMDSTFNILDFEGSVPSVVYVEGLVGWVYVKRPQDITRYEWVFDRLCAVALTPRESIELVAQVGAQHKCAERR